MPSIGNKIRASIPPLERWRKSVVGAPFAAGTFAVDPVADAAWVIEANERYAFTWNDVDMVMGALQVMYRPAAAAIADQWTLVHMNWDAHLWHIGEKIASPLPPREEPPSEALDYGVNQLLANYPIGADGRPRQPHENRASATAIRRCLLGGIAADLHDGETSHATQLTLFTLEGILRAITRARTKGICHPPSVVFNAYRRWFRTRFHPLVPGSLSKLDGWLAFEPSIHTKVRVGSATWNALKADTSGSPHEPINDSLGSDAVSRAAPAGFFNEDPFTLAAEIASLTHGHREAQHAAGAFAVIIHERVRGATLEFSVRQAVRRLDLIRDRELALRLCDAYLWGLAVPSPSEVAERYPSPRRAGDALCLAVLAASAAIDGRERRGEGWVGEEDVHTYNASNVRSIRSMVGQILGETSLPETSLSGELTRSVDRLANDVQTEFRDDDDWWRRYPGW
jgi:hypothetical protein